MRTVYIAILTLLSSGCASQLATSTASIAPPESPPVEPLSQTKVVETRYEIRGYAETVDSSVRHEVHAIYRKTKVPTVTAIDTETVPRTSFPKASVAALPANDELAAELAKQRAITADIQAMQASIAEIEKKMRTQYGQLVRQSAETLELQKKLLEQSRAGKDAQSPTPVPSSSVANVGETPTVKW